MIQIYRVHCNECKSESDVHHEMDSHQYEVQHCPFCGAEVTEDEVELIDEVETE